MRAEARVDLNQRTTTNFRITVRQKKALADEARKRASAKGLTMADASEVLREILDSWMEDR